MQRAHSVRSGRLPLLVLVAALAGDLCAQVTTGPQHRPGRRSICRHDDTLYLVAFVDTGEVTLWRRPEGASAWAPVPITGGINDSNSGITTSVPTNYAAVTATNDGVLHIAWGRASYPSFYEFYYRAIDPVAGTAVTNILDTTAFVGTNNLNRSDSIEIAAVDDAGSGQPAVYLTAQGSSSWVTRLLRFERTATGWPATPAPADLGNMSASASSQRPRIAVGPNGTVHTVFYNNSGNGNWVYRPWNGSWGAQVILGTGTVRQDNTGDVSVDPQGVVHAVYNHWLTTTQSEVRYQTLVGGSWSAPSVVHTPPANYSLDNLLAITTDVFGAAYVTYFNSNGDAVYRATSGGGFTAETVLLPTGLSPPSWPVVRGALFPVDNRNQCEIDLAYRLIATVPEQVLHVRVDTCTCATLGIGFSGAWTNGATGEVDLTGAAPNAFALCVLGLDLLPTPVPALGCPCPVFVTPEVLALQLVGAGGAAQVSVPIPAMPIGTTLWAQWLTLDANLANCQSTGYSGRYVP
ncbi:MAG TPA: hypothetical protein VFZ65_08670 [Planctomycetota bacterium]|nr:hypothetical protein [Planctomycetota bacterium]